MKYFHYDQHSDQKGFLSIVAILLIVVISFICMAATYQFVSDARQAANSLSASQAFYMAQSGIEYDKHLIRSRTLDCGTSVVSTTFTGAPGVFTVTSSFDSITHTCTLTATGYVPNTTSPIGKRTLQAVLISGGISPSPIVASGNVSLRGNVTINNPSVSSQSGNYAGSTILSGGAVTFTGASAMTTVSDLSPSSNATHQNADIVSGNTTLSTSTLFNQFFSGTKASTTAAATLVTTEAALQTLPAPNGMYYANPAFNLNSTYTIGTAANPAIIIANGNIQLNGNLTINGLLYVIGNFTILGTVTINGGIAVEGDIDKAAGNATINYDPAILNKLYSPSTVLHFNDVPASLKEIIP